MTAARIALALSILIFATKSFAKDELSFEQFLKAALDQNLDLKVEAAKSSAAESSSKALNVPPPMVGYMRMTDQSGSSASGFEVSQTIPFPTKISRGHSARGLESRAQDEARLAMESEIRASAKVIYFDLWAAQEKEDALKEKKGAIDSHIRLARAGVRSDSFLRIHLLKAESDLDLLENEMIAAHQEMVEREAAMANFLNVDATGFHPTLQEPPPTAIPEENKLESSHQIEFAKLTFEGMKARESEGRATWFPDLYLRYKEIGQTQLMPKTSEIMVGISLPFLFPWESSSASGKAAGQRMQAELEFEKTKRKINSEKATLLSKARSLKKQLDNISQKLLPRAERRMKLVHNLAPRDMETLQDHRETMEAFPDLKIKALELRRSYEATVAELLKFERGSR